MSKLSVSDLHAKPKHSEACDILDRFRRASTEREKRRVLDGIKHKYSSMAERMAKLLS